MAPHEFKPPSDPMKYLGMTMETPVEERRKQMIEIKKKWHPDRYAMNPMNRRQKQFIHDRFIWLQRQSVPNQRVTPVNEPPPVDPMVLKQRNRRTALYLCGFMFVGIGAQIYRFHDWKSELPATEVSHGDITSDL